MKLNLCGVCPYCNAKNFSINLNKEYLRWECKTCRKKITEHDDVSVIFTCFSVEKRKRSIWEKLATFGKYRYSVENLYDNVYCIASKNTIEIQNDRGKRNVYENIDEVFASKYKSPELDQLMVTLYVVLATGIMLLVVFFMGINTSEVWDLLIKVLFLAMAIILLIPFTGIFSSKYITSISCKYGTIFRLTKDNIADVENVLTKLGIKVNNVNRDHIAVSSFISENKITTNGFSPDLYKVELPESVHDADTDSLIDNIIDFRKFLSEEWMETIPLFSAIELDIRKFKYSDEIKASLDNYARHLKYKNYASLLESVV